jgi:hypothetical protein
LEKFPAITSWIGFGTHVPLSFWNYNELKVEPFIVVLQVPETVFRLFFILLLIIFWMG